MDEDLTVRARIDDELSRPLEDVREKVQDVGDEVENTNRRAGRGSRGWDLYGRATEKAGRLAHTAGRLIKGAAVAVGAGVAAAGYAAARLAKSSIQQASDLAESLNAVNVTYGKQAKAVKQLGREAARSIGLSKVEFNGMSVQFAAFATAIGGQGKGAVKVLDDVTTRAADFASVMNLDVAEAAALFQSGLAGESEPLRKYGINLSAAAVESYGLAKGIVETGEKMTDAQKVQATYGLLMEKTAKTQGDFTNTSDSLANQQRILGARFDNAQAKLGRGLLPLMQKGAQWLNREGVPAFVRFSDWFTKEGLPAIDRFVDKARTLYEKHGPEIKSTLADVRDVARQGADAAGELVDAFLNMPSWARKLLVGGLAGGVVAKKTGLLGLVKGLGKGSGGLLSLATKAKPLPVFVVNNGVPGSGLPGVDTPDKGRKPSKWDKGRNVARYIAPALLADAAYEATAGDLYGLDKTPGEKRQAVSPFGVGLAPPSEKDTAAHEAAAKRVEEAYQHAMDLARAKAAGFGTELDLVGARKINPTVKSDQIDRANDALYKFIGYQIDAGRPVAPYINTTSIERAIAAAQTLASTIHAIPTAGVDAGVNYVSGGTRPAPSPRRRGGGNDPVRTPAPRVRADTLLAPNPRAASNSNITIHDGAIRVDASNASSNVDVEQSVKRGIESWMREREERR